MPRKSPPRSALAAVSVLVGLVLGACGGDSTSAPSSDAGAGTARLVVTTSILGDVVANLVGDLADVEVVVPRGASPHDFQPSARQAAAMRDADVLVVNGGGFEAGLAEVVEAAAADGVPTFTALDTVAPLVDGAHHEGDGHDHGPVDPHFFTDPVRMREAAAALRAHAQGYLDALATLDRDVAQLVAAVPPQDRKLVTNHEVLGYFADRYGFEVVGAVIPSPTTQAEASASQLAGLAELVRAEGVRAVFADTSSPSRLADALSAEVGDVVVVELFTESLGPEGSEAGTYLGLVRTDAQRIADALSP